MDWIEPVVTWEDNDLVTATDFNRIEKDIKYLQELLG